MKTPVLFVLVGPNGAGKTTFYDTVVQPATRLPFINADHIAAEFWPDDLTSHAYEAAELAAESGQGSSWQLSEFHRAFASFRLRRSTSELPASA